MAHCHGQKSRAGGQEATCYFSLRFQCEDSVTQARHRVKAWGDSSVLPRGSGGTPDRSHSGASTDAAQSRRRRSPACIHVHSHGDLHLLATRQISGRHRQPRPSGHRRLDDPQALLSHVLKWHPSRFLQRRLQAYPRCLQLGS